MTSVHLGEWIDYFNEAHLGETENDRPDFRAAMIASVVANVNRQRGRAPIKLEEFLPKFQEPGEVQGIYTALGEIARPRRDPDRAPAPKRTDRATRRRSRTEAPVDP